MKKKLQLLKDVFYDAYPQGFEDAGLLEAVNRHGKNSTKLEGLSKEYFAPECMTNATEVCDHMAEVVGKSSLISLFEKPKFKDAIKAMSSERKELLSLGLQDMLHGSLENGYDTMVDVLVEDKLAKWSIMSLIPYYYDPKKFYFIKPTTTKNILAYFELEEPQYKPRPSFAFYKAYSAFLDSMKKEVGLLDNNAKYTGFFMIALDLAKDKKLV